MPLPKRQNAVTPETATSLLTPRTAHTSTPDAESTRNQRIPHTIRVSPVAWARLDAYLYRHRLPVGETVEAAILEYLDRHEGDA